MVSELLNQRTDSSQLLNILVYGMGELLNQRPDSSQLLKSLPPPLSLQCSLPFIEEAKKGKNKFL